MVQDYVNTESDYVEMASVEDIDRYARKLRTGKAAGSDGITAEYSIYSHPIVIVKLSLLFCIMLQHKFVPDNVGLGVITPLVERSRWRYRQF